MGIRTADLPWALWVVRDDSQRGSDWYRLMKKKAHWLGGEDTPLPSLTSWCPSAEGGLWIRLFESPFSL